MKTLAPPPPLDLAPHPYRPDSPRNCDCCTYTHHRCVVCGLPQFNRLHAGVTL